MHPTCPHACSVSRPCPTHSLRPYGQQPEGASVRGILQARALQLTATPSRLSPHLGVKPESLWLLHQQVGP